MAKEFKDYDGVYSAWKGVYLGYESHLKSKTWIQKRADEVTSCWRGDGIAKVYTNAEIRDAVYFAEGFEEWQKFRVSLKGCSTKHKLARLEYRWLYFHNRFRAEGDSDAKAKILWDLEQIRIDNYIYALRRGGQLDVQFNIAK